MVIFSGLIHVVNRVASFTMLEARLDLISLCVFLSIYRHGEANILLYVYSLYLWVHFDPPANLENEQRRRNPQLQIDTIFDLFSEIVFAPIISVSTTERT